jgi:hypothetical protein
VLGELIMGLAPEKCWHQKMADTRNALLPEKCRHQDTRNALALEKYRGNGECETGKEKWKEVGVGHKSVRQLHFIEDEMDAVDVYNRLVRSHLMPDCGG